MRVLLITSAYPTDEDDARGIFIHHLARALVREGVDITVLAPGAPGAPSSQTRDGVKVRRATYWIKRWQGLAIGVGGIVPNLRRTPWLVFQVPVLVGALAWRAVRIGGGFDLIHAHWVYPAGLAGILSGSLNNIPVVVTSHGGDLNLSRRSLFLRLLSRITSRAADTCVGVSHAMVEEFVRLGVPQDRVKLIPLGVEGQQDPAPLVGHLLSMYEEFHNFEGLRVVYVGSLIPRKSVHTLLEAQLILQLRGQQVATLLVGAGPAEGELRRFVQDKTLHGVEFVGAQPPNAVPRWIMAADVLVLPSRSEGRGLVLVEAMALGLPVVATDIPGPRELAIPGKTGMRFPAGDAHALADCLDRLAGDGALRQRLGEGGRSFIRTAGLTTQHSAQLHVELYKSVRTRRTARPAGAHAPLGHVDGETTEGGRE